VKGDEISNKLQAPFSPAQIEWRVGATTGDKTRGIALAYVTNRAIQTRLDEVFGPFGWKNEFREWKNNSQLCGISVFENNEWITKWDGANDSETEATKGGLSDAMKRAAVQWGIGRYLYDLESEWVPIVLSGKSYRLAEIPRLPAWALPQGFSYENKGSDRQSMVASATAEGAGQVQAKAPGEGKKSDITERQIGAIQKKRLEYSLTEGDLQGLMRFAFQANALTELDKAQASLLIGDMKSLWEEYAVNRSKR
jgi:hypothetical protein